MIPPELNSTHEIRPSPSTFFSQLVTHAKILGPNPGYFTEETRLYSFRACLKAAFLLVHHTDQRTIDALKEFFSFEEMDTPLQQRVDGFLTVAKYTKGQSQDPRDNDIIFP